MYPQIGAVVIGRRLFDLTDGWDGVPAAGDHVFVVTHTPPTDWKYAGTAPFTFVRRCRGRDRAGPRVRRAGPDVDVAAGQIGGQALRLGLIDQVVMNVVPVVFGAGRPFFGAMGPGDNVTLDNPSRVAQGDRVTHLLYDVVNPAVVRGLTRRRVAQAPRRKAPSAAASAARSSTAPNSRAECMDRMAHRRRRPGYRAGRR